MSMLTHDAIRRAALMLDETGRPPQLFAYALWPDGDAVVIEHEQGQRILANPSFWSRIPMSNTLATDPTLAGFPAFMGLRVIDLDLPENKRLMHDVMLDLVARLGGDRPPCDLTDRTRPKATSTDRDDNRE